MPFHFPWQAVLHLRQGVERQQELRLLAANQQVAQVRQNLEKLNQQIEQARSQRSQELGTGTTGSELRFELLCDSAVLVRRAALESDLMRVQKLRDEQQRIFRHARRQRETLEGLRDLQHHQYEREAMRRQQRVLDDLFLLRVSRLRRG